MSFYIRKSLRAGPIRFNFSKSGVGVSAGIPGFRIGSGPRGNYIHAGRNGFYYRQTIGGKKRKSGKSPTSPALPSTEDTPSVSTSSVQMEAIESGDVLQMQDSSSAELLAEIRSKYKHRRTWPFVAVLFVIALFMFTFFPVLMSQIPVLEPFATPFFCLCFPVILVFAGVVIFLAFQRDQLTKTVIMFYELEGEVEEAYQKLYNALKEIGDCSRVWHVEAQGNIHDINERKRQAGASHLLERKTIKVDFKSPPYVSTNLSIPTIPVGRQSIYFFPDRILVYDNEKVGAVSYRDLNLEVGNTRFIEGSGVPQDAKVVDRTWQYVNKKGGPDRRFKNNRELPIALYSEIYFLSQSGLNEMIQISKSDQGQAIVKAIKALATIPSKS